jgi:hypothetical protein
MTGDTRPAIGGLSPRTWQLVQVIFPKEAGRAARLLAEECGQNLPFCEAYTEYELERIRFAALKLSKGSLKKLEESIEVAKRDWRDLLVWSGFANALAAHEEWAARILENE